MCLPEKVSHVIEPQSSAMSKIERETQVSKEQGWFSVRYFNNQARFVFVDSSTYGTVWVNCVFFVVLHIYFAYTMFILFSEKRWNSWIWTYLFGTLSGIGVTCGAHRLWAHKAYSAKLPLRIFLVILHTMAGQNDMFTWVRDHRLHHKYTETDADPHNSRRGAFFAHVGWLLTKKHPDVLIKGRSISNDDIMADPVCFYQKKYYVIMYLFFRLILPMTVPMYMWDEQFQWAFVGVFAQYITSLHITWFVNSAAHIFGDRPYNDKIQPRENIWVTWIVLGEGFHNYHHTFPWDYRIAETGLTWYDPARLFIDTMAYMGLAYNLKRASETVVSRTRQTLGSSSSHRDSVQGDINVKKVPSCDLEFYVNDHPYEKPQPYCDDTNETDPLIS